MKSVLIDMTDLTFLMQLLKTAGKSGISFARF